MYDTLFFGSHVEQLNTGRFCVFCELQYLNFRLAFKFIHITYLSRNTVIHGAESFTDLAHLATCNTQTVKGLWTGHFMD